MTELFNLVPIQRRVCDKMCEQRCDVAAERLLQKRAAFLTHASLAGDGSPVDVPRSVDVVRQRPFFDEPRQKRADRAVIPIVRRAKLP